MNPSSTGIADGWFRREGAKFGDTPATLTHFRQAGALARLPAERDFIARRICECEAAD